ncbi:MAG: lasso peptide biosynthesis B2 protein [Terriglobales bacterium]
MARLPEPREIPILMRSAALLCAVRLALLIVPFPKLRWVVASLARTRSRPASSHSAEQLSWAVRAVSRYVPHATCLTQAVVLHILLRREGLPSRIRIGVSQDAGRFQAHAWVESQNRVVIGDSGLRRYAPIMVWE